MARRNHAVVPSPFGLAVPFSWAWTLVIAVIVLVVTVGALNVVNRLTPLTPVPAAFEAMAQK